MAYTLIEVSRKTQIPHTKLKFWIKKGLFSYVERGVFSPVKNEY